VQDLPTERPAADSVDLGRRRALKAAICLGTIAIAPVSIASTTTTLSARNLALVNMHTGESLEITYFDGDDYIPAALRRVNELMRDHRAEQVHNMSTVLLDALHDLRTNIGADQPFQLLSGYRSPQTNAMLRSKRAGVAKRSYHMQGLAADIRLQGFKLSAVRKQALALKAGGVGYYPKSGFIHVDVGPVRAWRG